MIKEESELIACSQFFMRESIDSRRELKENETG